MNKIWRVLLSASLVVLIALLTCSAMLDYSSSYSMKEETNETEVINNEDNSKKVEDQEQKQEEEKTEKTNKLVFYSGLVLAVIVIGAMLIVFLSKAEAEQ